MYQQKGQRNSRQEKIQISPYISEFLTYLGKTSPSDLSEDEIFIFKAFSLQQQIYHLFLQLHQEHKKNHSILPYPQVQAQILSYKAVSLFKSELENGVNGVKSTQVKDRKTSFFRIILRFLKKKQKQKKEQQMEDEEACVFLKKLQEKLSGNTISGDDIKILQTKFKNQITQYLSSTQIYKDLLTINKSKNNKFFYLLHLKELEIVFHRGKLPYYSFYANKEFERGLKQMIKNFYLHFFQQHEKKEESKEIDKFLDDEFEKFCQEAEEGREKEKIMEYDFYDEEEENEENNFGIL